MWSNYLLVFFTSGSSFGKIVGGKFYGDWEVFFVFIFICQMIWGIFEIFIL